MCRVSLCVAFGRLEFFSLIICLFVSSDACVLKKRHERRDCRPWVLSYFFFRLCLFSFGWAFNIITKLMLCCFGSCAVFPYLACSRNSALFFFSSLFFMISHRMIATHIHNDIYVCTRLYKHSRRPGPLRSFPPPHFPRSPLSLDSFHSLLLYNNFWREFFQLWLPIGSYKPDNEKETRRREKKRGAAMLCVWW